MTREEARALDATDPIAHLRDAFDLRDDIIYLDGNSLGPLPHATATAVTDAVGYRWGKRLIRSWNEDWIDAPERIGAKIARLIGADPDEVIIADSTSINLFKLLVAALRLTDGRHEIIGETGNFPTDLHVAEGAVGCVPGAHLRVVPRGLIKSAIGKNTAVALLTHVHYKTGERFDLTAMTALAHDHGAMTLWDLSHSIGAVPLDVRGADVDLAVGCTYKYLNGGPGAPAFLFVSKRLQGRLDTPLSGWMGHAAPFEFDDAYAPAAGMKRWLVGTPPILSMAALEAAVDLWMDVRRDAVWSKSAALFDILAETGDAIGIECVTPRKSAERGSHISFRHPHAYAICQALIERGVIGDFRNPDILRLGLTPLYLRYEDVVRAGDELRKTLAACPWQDERFNQRMKVT